MKEFYKKRFALTDKGARNLSKATLASFFVYCINMLPAILLMIFAQEVLENIEQSKGFYIVFSVLTLIAMYILLSGNLSNIKSHPANFKALITSSLVASLLASVF